MALLAEEIVEEWLNRQGYFTIRGIKIGVHEIDLLAVRPQDKGGVECRHIEVQASMRPVSYISKVPKEIQRSGKAANSASRSDEELLQGVAEWVEKKFLKREKKDLMRSLWPGEWSSELVVNNIKCENELKLIASHGIQILRLADIVRSLGEEGHKVSSAAGGDIVDLIQMGTALT